MRGTAALPYALSLLLHLALIGLLGLIRVTLPAPPPPSPVEVVLVPAHAFQPGPPGEARKSSERKLPSAETVLPEEVLAEEALRRLQAREKETEARLFGGGQVAVKIEGILTRRGLVRHSLPPPLPLIRDEVVQLRVQVDRDGQVIGVEVLRRGTPEVERAAVDAVRKWRFEPLPEGVVEIQEGIVTFFFRLKSAPPNSPAAPGGPESGAGKAARG